jgi:2-polyprenyl-6-methoxyphenol hydroxylase-like FAD-dependent oxidoreductase
MGARGLNLPSVEAFYRRGLLKAIRESSIAWFDATAQPSAVKVDASGAEPPPRFVGHFAGIMLDANKVDLSHAKFMTRGPAASGGLVSLEAIERLLARHAKKLGAELRLGAEVTAFAQDDDGVTVHLGNETVRSKWLVGCDGGRSTVRKCAGFDFPGTGPEFTGTIAMADLANAEDLRPGFNLTPKGMYASIGPGRIGYTEFDGGSHDRDTPITAESFQEGLRRISGTDVIVTKLHVATRYTDNARQATTYRNGRILLAGDAAHVHSPLGGQGLNLGIGDAMNLGWKLSATIRGNAPYGLLDTYTAERHPIGAWALDWTRAQVAIMRPDPYARSIAAVVRDLINTRDGSSYFAEKISGIWMRYNLPGDHPFTGRSAPDLELEDGSRLGDHLHDGHALLLDLSSNTQLQSLSQRWPDRLKYIAAGAKDSMGLTALFVRPDGFVAWATDSEPDPAQAAQAIARWLGSES